MATEAVNIEAIMEEIRADIRRKGYTDDAAVFHAPLAPVDVRRADPVDSITEQLEVLEQHWSVNPVPPLEAGNPLVRFIKRCLRKLMKFYVVPGIESQNEVNERIVYNIRSIRDYLAQQQRVMDRCDTLELAFTQQVQRPFDRMQDKMEHTQAQACGLVEELSAVRAEIEALQQRVASLETGRASGKGGD